MICCRSPCGSGAGGEGGNRFSPTSSIIASDEAIGIIYALSDLALVVSANLEKGGTWNGAVENLKHRWAPLFVRAEEPQPPGNRRLIELGGYAVDRNVLDRRVSLDDWLDGREFAGNTELPLPPARPVSDAEEAPLPTEEDDARDARRAEGRSAVAANVPAQHIEEAPSVSYQLPDRR